jgi:hypothetical protein
MLKKSLVTSKPVMPAKAGIQNSLKYWIPAFAGMTATLWLNRFSTTC